MSEIYSDQEYISETDLIDEYTIDDYLNNPETEYILESEFFENVKKNMSENIENFYKREVEYSTENFMNIFNKDLDAKNSYDFFLTIYPFIAKNYDISIFDNFPFLAKSLIVNKEEETNIKKEKVVFESKKYDWGREEFK